jgi:conjugative relaxase-like TrwC/TraI family protein
VLSIAKLTQGQERYYQQSVAQGLDDYYGGRGESPGVWAGRGAEVLGLQGVVEDGQLTALCRGRDPGSDELLRRPARQRTITVERIDPYTGGSRLEKKRLAPVCGFDLVFSAPKSVSLLHALGDAEVRHQVNHAHLAAWHAAVGYLEDEACVVRRGRNGVIREQAEGFVAAAYQHRTSRARDPQLHTHVIVANMARTPSDEKWRALDANPLLKTYRLAAGYLYQAHLRHELSARLGVEWERPVKGMAEIKGVPREALAAFSRRREQLLEHMREHSTAGYYAARVAALVTRDRKPEIDLPRLREEWLARAAEHGLGREELLAVLGRRREQRTDQAQLLRVARQLLGPTGLTEKRTAFSDPELVMAWAEAIDEGVSASKLRRIITRFTALDDVKPVGDTETPGRPARYSTRELISTEQAALDLAERGRGAPAPTLDPATIEAVIKRRRDVSLSPEQAAFLREAAVRSDRVVCVVGRAGAGKTTALRAVAEGFAAVGTPVVGAAPSGVAARKLRDETGLEATTLHRLLADYRDCGLPARCVVLIDEAGMAETRVLGPTLGLVERAQGKAILVGDPSQLPAVGAGGLFAGLVERWAAVELTDNRRQHDELEQQMLARIREGLGREYLSYVERTKRLVVADDPAGARARLLTDWWRAARDDRASNVMIALRRSDVAELNALARRLMDAEGLLGKERLTIGDKEFAVGDRVVCKRNNPAIGVQNGTRATVARIDGVLQTLSIATDHGEQIGLPRRYLEHGHLRHGYALTGHTSQGLTVDRAFVLGSGESRLQEWGYVAFSRARTETRIYVTGAVPARESHAHHIDLPDPLTRLAQALEESQVERLAVDQQPHLDGPRHQTRPEIAKRTLTDRERHALRVLEHHRLATEKMIAVAESRVSGFDRVLDKVRGPGPRARSLERLHDRRDALEEQAERVRRGEINQAQVLRRQ